MEGELLFFGLKIDKIVSFHSYVGTVENHPLTNLLTLLLYCIAESNTEADGAN